jgi:hypothetical protein
MRGLPRMHGRTVRAELVEARFLFSAAVEREGFDRLSSDGVWE